MEGIHIIKKSTKRPQNKNNFILYIIAVLVIILTIVSLCTIFSAPSLQDILGVTSSFRNSDAVNSEDKMSVHILDVGKADAIHINSGDKNILIDAGDVDITNPVTEYLKKNNISKLDFVIATHPHRDHIGGMKDIINKLNIESFMMPEIPENIVPTSKTYESMLSALSQNNISVDKPKPGNNLNIGNMEINILGPNKQYNNLNNNSVVVKIKYLNRSFLFMGDAEAESENDLLVSNYNLKSDVLKVGHHGSKTSTTQKFLDAVLPEYAVISVGPDSNNLPKTDVINRINKNNIKLYRTDINGNVTFITNGNTIDIKTEKE